MESADLAYDGPPYCRDPLIILHKVFNNYKSAL